MVILILPPINISVDGTVIDNGILMSGRIKKSISNMIVSHICNDYGYKVASQYINDLQKLTSRYLVRSGYSVGVSDLIVHKDIKKRNENIIAEAKKEVVELTKKVHLNILEDISEGLDEIYDVKISAIAGDKFNKGIISETLKLIEPDNRMKFIVDSGAKGDSTNLCQMMCLVGQQIIDGKRVPLCFHERTLPHYPRYENGIESRGFITSSFLDGLRPQEFFFHAMSGREGIIDTAVKTANSGYLQRKLIKATEDLKVCHDMTVRSSNNDIVEFCDKWVSKGKILIVGGLDGTYERKLFHVIGDLIPKSEEIIKLKAICSLCGEDAIFTKRNSCVRYPFFII